MCTATIARAGRACLAGLASFALVILPASLAEAEYGPRTKIGANYQQTSSTTSPNGRTEGSCNGSFECYVLFQVPPGQKALIVQHVSCNVFVTQSSLRFGLLMTRKGQDFLLKRTHLLPVATNDGNWVVNSPVMHLIAFGERPLVYILNSVGVVTWQAECTISGQLR